MVGEQPGDAILLGDFVEVVECGCRFSAPGHPGIKGRVQKINYGKEPYWVVLQSSDYPAKRFGFCYASKVRALKA